MAAPATTPVQPTKKTPTKVAGKNNSKGQQRNVGRPQKNFFLKASGGFKQAATGETRNSPFTDPNILFWLGIGLIIFSGFSSGRIKDLFSMAWNGGESGKWFTTIKVVGSQFLFLFLMVITARAVPPLARIWLVIIGGLWILYIMKNPQIVQLLNWTSVGATSQAQYNSIVQQLANSMNTATNNPVGSTGAGITTKR